MKLSQHFSLIEFAKSAKAQSLGIDNTPSAEVVKNLTILADMLERIRSTINKPIIITSGYRSEALNRAVGGRTSSDHTKGYAADIVCPAFGTPRELARLLAPLADTLSIGQVILEEIKGKQWVHVSTKKPLKAINRVLTISDAGTFPGIIGQA